MTTAKIVDIAAYLPDNVLGNDELARLYPEWPVEKIFDKTGIKERRIAADDQTAGDLAFLAANALFTQGKINRHDVDFIILCTQAPDYVLPTTACLLQDRLGIATTAGALDVNLGCSGFVYGLSLAKGLIETGSARCVLLITADTYSKYIHPMDKSVRTLFGDAAAATAITASNDTVSAIGPFVFGTDGSGGKHLIVESGMYRKPKSTLTAMEVIDDSGNTRSSENLYMNGAEVMSFSLRVVPRTISELLEKSKITTDQIDFYVLHQANKFMLEALRKKIKIPAEKLPIVMQDCGNTVSSTIPLAILELRKSKKLLANSKLMLVGFGVGLSWAACLVNI